MAGSINKSCSLEKTPAIISFIKAQKNFSKSIYLLIMQSIMSHQGKAVDIYAEYEKHMEREFFNSCCADYNKNTNSVQSPNLPSIQPSVGIESSANNKITDEPLANKTMLIPEEYI